MQHHNLTSEQLQNIITNRASNHFDVLVPYDELVCEITNLEETADQQQVSFKYPLGTAEFDSHSISQLFRRINLSHSFWKRLNDWGAHSLMVDCANFCIEASANEITLKPRVNDPTFLFRLTISPETINQIESLSTTENLDSEEEQENNFLTPVRGVLSSSYSKFDDNELFPLLMSILDDNENMSYTLYEYDHQLTRLHIKFNDTEVEYEGKKYHAGMIVTNSEVGLSSIWIEPCTYRDDLSFTNRDVLKKQDVQMKLVHRGDIDREKVGEMFSFCSQIAQVGITQLIESLNEEIEPKFASSLVKNIVEFPSRIASILEEEWEQEEKLKKETVTSALLEVASTLPLFQRAKVEQAVGKMLNLYCDYTSRITQITEELNEIEAT